MVLTCIKSKWSDETTQELSVLGRAPKGNIRLTFPWVSKKGEGIRPSRRRAHQQTVYQAWFSEDTPFSNAGEAPKALPNICTLVDVYAHAYVYIYIYTAVDQNSSFRKTHLRETNIYFTNLV